MPTTIKNSKKTYGSLGKQMETVFGPLIIEDPIIDDLIHSHAMQRLKRINQFGVSHYLQKSYKYTRFDHSLGVYHLLKIYKAPLLEQIAGLLHDVSHTAFSHVADVVFDHRSDKSSYQDDIHQWFLYQTDIPAVVEKYGLTIEQTLHKEGDFPAMETDLPDICADRIEYLVHQAVKEAYLTLDELQLMLQHLKFDNGIWYFTDLAQASKLGTLSLQMTDKHFSAPWNVVTYYLAADAIKHALKKGIISKEQLHFSVDDSVWQILSESSDETIQTIMMKLHNLSSSFTVVKEDHDLEVHPKFRGVNPWVQIDGIMHRLIDVDPSYAVAFDGLKQKLATGYRIKFL